MSNWIEHFNKAVDLIPYRKAGGMYNKIAKEAYQAGFEAGEEQAKSDMNNRLEAGINSFRIRDKLIQEAGHKALYAVEDSHPAISKSGEAVQEVWISEAAPVSQEAWDSLNPKEAKVDK